MATVPGSIERRPDHRLQFGGNALDGLNGIDDINRERFPVGLPHLSGAFSHVVGGLIRFSHRCPLGVDHEHGKNLWELYAIVVIVLGPHQRIRDTA